MGPVGLQKPCPCQTTKWSPSTYGVQQPQYCIVCGLEILTYGLSIAFIMNFSLLKVVQLVDQCGGTADISIFLLGPACLELPCVLWVSSGFPIYLPLYNKGELVTVNCPRYKCACRVHCKQMVSHLHWVFSPFFSCSQAPNPQ